MNRKIKFRGKGIEEYDKGKWYYGSYFIYNAINYFCLDDGSRTKEINEKIKNNIKHKIIFEVQGDLNMENYIKLADVNPETVGQYTGLYDKNGKEIYEGDIVKVDNIDLAIIYFDDDRMAWGIKPINDFYFDSPLLSENISLELRAIGNIYDNPELSGGE